MGVHDFAGSGAVHLLGACSALVACAMLGKRRIIDQIRLEKPGTLFVPCKNEVQQLNGTFLLGLAWLSFNCGSIGILSEGNNIQIVGMVAANTLMGGAAGMLAGMIASLYEYKVVRVEYTTNTLLGGLVAITANCDVTSPLEATVIGFLSIIPLYFGIKFLEKYNIDDPLYAIPVHGGCGYV